MKWFKASVRRQDLEGNPDAWWVVCHANTREIAHDEAMRQIREMNRGRENPTLYHIVVTEVTK